MRLVDARRDLLDTEEASRLWHEAHDLYKAVNIPAGIAETAARLARSQRGPWDTTCPNKPQIPFAPHCMLGYS